MAATVDAYRRAPSAAPFSVGTVLRYKGESRPFIPGRVGTMKAELPANAIVIVTRVFDGAPGEAVKRYAGQKTPFLNPAQDGYSSIRIVGGRDLPGRGITAATAHEWEVVND